jgi:hypothetical protein
MAREYSKDTEAIIQRLRDEGDLIRDSGTNSLKTVGSKLDKFGDVFKSINNGIQAQSVMLKQAQGIAEEQYEYTKRQREFDDLKSEKLSDDTRKNAEARDAKLIDGVTKAFNLGNLTKLLVGGAGLAAAGLIGKGFMDERFPNAFDGMKGTVADLRGTIDGMNQAAAELTRTVNEIKTDMQKFKDSVPWGALAVTLAGLALLPSRAGRFGFGLAAGAATGAYRAYRGARQGDAGLAQAKAIKEAQERAAKEAAEAAAKEAQERAAREAAEAAAKRAAQTAASDDKLIAIAAEQAAKVAQQEAAEAAAKRTAAISASVALQQAAYADAAGPNRYRVQPPPLPKGPAGMFTAPGNMAPPNINVIETRPGVYTYQDMDNNKFMSREVAQQRLSAAGFNPDGTPNYGKAPRQPRVGPRSGDAGLAEARRMLQVGEKQGADLLANADRGLMRKMVASETTKIAIKWIPALGAVVGIGFTAYSLIIGDYTTAGLETIGVAMPSVVGIAADIAAATTSIFFHVGGVGPYNQFNPAHRALYMEIAAMLRDSVDKYMEDKARARAERAAQPSQWELLAREAEIKGGNARIQSQATYYERNESGGFLGLRRYSVFNAAGQFVRYSRTKPEGTTSMDGFRINQARNTSYPSAQRQMARAQMVAAGAIGTGGQYNIHMGDTVQAPMSYTEGSKSQANVRMNGGGGGGATDDPFNNLPPGIN